jgi:hypothetical protein
MTTPIIPGGVTDVSGAPVRRPSDKGKFGTFWQPGMDRQNPAPTGGTAGPVGGAVRVTVSGPVYGDPGLRGEIGALVEDIQYRVAAAALERVQYNLDRSIQHPTPYYETQIMMQRIDPDTVVHDRGIVYGPWLEGTSSRNHTTRFKGYASFRRAVDDVRQHHVLRIARQVVAEFTQRMN